MDSFYMDDCICSFDNLVGAQLFKEEAIEVMKKASFELRGWVMTGDSDENAVLVLGTRWNAEKDLIGCTAERPAGALTVMDFRIGRGGWRSSQRVVHSLALGFSLGIT